MFILTSLARSIGANIILGLPYRMDKDQMPKVDLVKDKANISRVVVDYMKLMEKENLARVTQLKQLRKRNNLTGLLLGGAVFGVYLYTILSVKQEKFLDDFEPPELVEKN